MLDLGKEGRAFGVVLFAQLFEFAQEFFLLRGQVHRRLNRQFDHHVADAATAERWHAFATQAHLAAGLAAC